MKIVPEPMRAAPATGAIFVVTTLVFLVMAVAALPSSPLAFSGYTLQQAGATTRMSLALGEWWRLVTSNFIHHDLVHLGFNLYCLALVGPIVETFFGRKKTLLMYFAAGVGSMAVSHFWYAVVLNQPYTSAGASGAVCGLIGLAWMGSNKFIPAQPHIANGMKRWAVMLAIWGFVVPGINNAAHAGGFVVGIILGKLVSVGAPKGVAKARALSVATLSAVLAVAACGVIAVVSAAPYPFRLNNDAHGASLMGFELGGDRPEWADSTQLDVLMACQRLAAANRPLEEIAGACEFALRASPYQPVPAYEYLEQIERQRGDERRARQLNQARAIIREMAER
ncbi:MAG: rhomboid protease GluP [Bradymonadia bacterium]|jgi:rhomboid protease GluP